MAGGSRASSRNGGRSLPNFVEPDGYAYLSTRPLHILVFLLPLVIAYEVGSVLFLSRGSGEAARVIRAERLLSSFFELFGVGGLYLPGVLLVVVLLIWHVLTRDRWRVRWGVPGGMILESVLWTLPLLVLGQMIFRAIDQPSGLSGMLPWAELSLQVSGAAGGSAGSGVVANEAPALLELSKPALATISIGAGLYEELLFRLVAIALIHAVAADALRIKDGPSKVIAVFLSAVAFALYHDVMVPGGGGIDPARLAVYTMAGLYFGAVFVLRGFGIVVAVHAMYDLAVLVLLPR